MFKILNQSQFDIMKSGSDAFNAISAEIMKSNTEIKSEDITSDIILKLLNANEDDGVVAQLNSRIQDADKTITSLRAEIDGLKARVEELSKLPAEEPAAASSSSEPDSKPKSLSDFANENRGNTAAIINHAVNDGFLFPNYGSNSKH
jgi:FtsZ-binding cell division protein ZapB